MSRSAGQLEEDRALRNSARALFRKELAEVRQEVTPRALGERVADRVGRKVDAASDRATGFVSRHGGALAAAGGAIVTAAGLWFARKPILERVRPWFEGSGKPNRTANGGRDEEADDE
jgi:hypothetical protein